MRAQVSLTVSESKRLIAEAIAVMPSVRRALDCGKILLRGGTTVSALAEKLTGAPLRVAGRITPHGAKAAYNSSHGAFCLLLEGGKAKEVDSCVEDVAATMGEGDVAITGANAIDVHGNAGIMCGVPGCGGPGRAFRVLRERGVTILVAAGWEKLIPGAVGDAVSAACIDGTDLAMGMAVGLIPITGTIVTETRALETLAEVRATVIGSGGILGAEGAVTLVLEGVPAEVQQVFALVQGFKGAALSGVSESIPECVPESATCHHHPACVYRQAVLARNAQS